MGNGYMKCSIIFVLSLLCVKTHAELSFKTKINSYDTDIYAYDATQHIGFVSYRNIPLLSFYVIHSLYVYPQHRKKGYGTALISYVCDKIQQQGATRVYIQPGPFELKKNKPTDEVPAYWEKMKYLVLFYHKLGFKKVNHITSIIMSMIYPLLGIHEHARYLMVKTFNS